MGLLHRLKGYRRDDAADPRAGGTAPQPPVRTARTEDELVVDRYRYLLRTAPPEAVEEVHAEAFATLSPQRRRMVFEELSRHAAVSDRPPSDDPRIIARSATRSELRQPGFLERTLGSGPRGAELGTVVDGSLLGTVAGVVIASAIAGTVLPGIGDLRSDVAGAHEAADGRGEAVSGVEAFGGDRSAGGAR